MVISDYEDVLQPLIEENAILRAALAIQEQKVQSITSQKIDHFNRWARGETFAEWQAEQKRQQLSEKNAAQLRKALGL